jgi:hypothetical protein
VRLHHGLDAVEVAQLVRGRGDAVQGAFELADQVPDHVVVLSELPDHGHEVGVGLAQLREEDLVLAAVMTAEGGTEPPAVQQRLAGQRVEGPIVLQRLPGQRKSCP